MAFYCCPGIQSEGEYKENVSDAPVVEEEKALSVSIRLMRSCRVTGS